MPPSGPSNVLPEVEAAERLRQHLEEIARERDRAHRALQEREAELARIQRIARVGGLEIDFRDGVKNRRSPEYLLVHGLPPESANETYGDWVGRIHPEDRERTVKHLFGVLRRTSTDYSAEYRIIRPNDGEIRWIRVVARIERGPDGRAQRLIGADLGDQARPHAIVRQPGLCRFSRPAVRASHRIRLAQGTSSGRFAACRSGIGCGRGLAETVRPRSALSARRRRMALAAIGIPAALGSDRRAYRLHRRRPRHYRIEAGRKRFAPAQ